MIEKKVYSGYAFTENSDEKMKMNREIYEEIKDKAKVEFHHVGYGHAAYRVIENPEHLPKIKLALICDSGNLCFGYRTEGDLIVIYTD